jgi:hypothetical protein
MNDSAPMLVPNRETVATAQVHTLLHITNALQGYLLGPHREFDPSNPHPELDGGALAAATVTFCNVCKRLDEILADPSRWNLDKTNELYSALTKTQAEQQRLLAAQTKVAENALLPSTQLRPSLFQHGGIFLAIYGDPAIASGHIVGRGHTPEAALHDFNLAFKRLANDQFRVEVEQDETPNPKKNKSK